VTVSHLKRRVPAQRSGGGTAANWPAFDTYLDHGMVANAVKHDRIDQAAQAARAADQRLAALCTDLAELGGYEPTAPRLEVTAGFKFADIFFGCGSFEVSGPVNECPADPIRGGASCPG
jgi:hypothetical protein